MAKIRQKNSENIILDDKLIEKKIYKTFCVDDQHLDHWLNNRRIKVNTIEDADIVFFPGGGDVNPTYYGEFVGKNTHFHNGTDMRQMRAMLECIEQNKFMFGICRGMQLGWVVAGGKLIQHTTGHTVYSHQILAPLTEECLDVNSIHHQMLLLNSLPENYWSLVAHSVANRSSVYLDGNDEPIDIKCVSSGREFEPEAVMINTIKMFGVQFHPEMGLPARTNEWLIRCLDIYFKLYENHSVSIKKGDIVRRLRENLRLVNVADRTTTMRSLSVVAPPRKEPEQAVLALPPITTKNEHKKKKQEYDERIQRDKDWAPVVKEF